MATGETTHPSPAAKGGALAPAAKPAKSKKAKAPKEARAKKAAATRKPSAHPPYAEMIKEAITTLKERTGSSPYAIGKFIEDKHKAHLPSNFRKILFLQLKKLAAAGKLTKVKSSYKLSTIVHTAPAEPKSAAGAKKPAAVKTKLKAKAKPAAAASKTKAKIATTAKAKSKHVASTAKPKPKAAAAKPGVAPKRKSPVKPKPRPTARPTKAAKTTAKGSPGKKAAKSTSRPKPAAASRRSAPTKKPTRAVKKAAAAAKKARK
ncbi:unnamed protein product [Musa textilis]